MTKKEILDYFSNINDAYNDSTRFDSLSHMIDELLKEQETKTGKWVLDDEDANSWECSECGGLLVINADGTPHENDWYFCPYCGSKLEELEVQGVKLE